jgi:hypothetical protein
VIVVLGTGRSGTSLLMQALSRGGMFVSPNMTKASEQNELGGYEDSDIFQIHSDLLAQANTTQYLPLPNDWLNSINSKIFKDKMTEVILNRLNSNDGTWGFKDPRTVFFIPLWNKVFNSLKIVPRYFVAVRSPASTIVSLKNKYGKDESTSELFWLYKTCLSLSHTGANCYLVHYEDWFSKQVDCASFLKFAGLESINCDDFHKSIFNELINPSLNRSIYEDYSVKNEFVHSLYSVLSECKGNDFDRAKLMGVVKECRKYLDSFNGWNLEYRQFNNRNSQALKQLKSECSRINVLEVEIESARKYVSKWEEEKNKNRESEKVINDYIDKLNVSKNRIVCLEIEFKNIKSSFAYALSVELSHRLKKSLWYIVFLPIDAIKVYKKCSANFNRDATVFNNVKIVNDSDKLLDKNNNNVSLGLKNQQLSAKKNVLKSEYDKLLLEVAKLDQGVTQAKSSSVSYSDDCAIISTKILRLNEILLDIKRVDELLLETCLASVLEDDLRTPVVTRNSVKERRTMDKVSHLPSYRLENKIKSWRHKFVLGTPDSVRIKQHFVKAKKHPGKETILFPLRFVKYLLEVINFKLRSK